MVETSTLTPHQELFNKLKTGHPQKQILLILERVEKLEAVVLSQDLAVVKEELVTSIPDIPDIPDKQPEGTPIVKKRGRPKGSKNKV